MTIRNERPGDEAAIGQLVAEAFAGAEHSSGTESAIVAGLRAAGALSVSLVACDEGVVVGHVAVSPVTIRGRDCGWFGLGPVAVRPGRQGRGIGAALVAEALARLREMRAKGIVVLGDPAYYGRFGFEHDPKLRYAGAPGPFFQRLAFAAEGVQGEVRYHPAFDG